MSKLDTQPDDFPSDKFVQFIEEAKENISVELADMCDGLYGHTVLEAAEILLGILQGIECPEEDDTEGSKEVYYQEEDPDELSDADKACVHFPWYTALYDFMCRLELHLTSQAIEGCADPQHEYSDESDPYLEYHQCYHNLQALGIIRSLAEYMTQDRLCYEDELEMDEFSQAEIAAKSKVYSQQVRALMDDFKALIAA